MHMKDLCGFHVENGDFLESELSDKSYEVIEVNHYGGYEVDVTVVEVDQDNNRIGEEFEADALFFLKVSEIIR
ncbi:hypothetical protein [Chengkuizengella axinellae]|uniref:DUF1292 domain-containing protein n=1 Tax=Chengkuizengella axinellae TaxID=3064388 RepID=A0ABT9IYM9_9BACL|nr:hypothetical protein [Chengkuizengella sp. 2205SS18-9]MDP5274333.1 hypothetical protein [Chengkuizengella sp. 2205SS18-9]